MPDHWSIQVIYAADVDLSKLFYETIGLPFVREKHGEGPVHYACDLGLLLLEIYPLPPGRNRPAENRHGGWRQYVADFEKTMSGLRAIETKVVKIRVYDPERGLRSAILRDPDGNLVTILEIDPREIQ